MLTYNYNPEYLIILANDYLFSKHDYITPPHDLVLRERTFAYHDALVKACDMVRADVDTVLATAKAMRRYEKKNGYTHIQQLPKGFSLHCDGTGQSRSIRFFSR